METVDSAGNVHHELLQCQVAQLGGKHNIFLGYNWLQKHNPTVDWQTRELEFDRCPSQCGMPKKVEEPLPEEVNIATQITTLICRLEAIPDECPNGLLDEDDMDNNEYQMCFLRQLTGKVLDPTPEIPPPVNIPKAYQDYKDIFDAEEFNQLLPHCP